MHADLVERPAGPGQERVNVAGDQAGAEEPDPGRPRPAAPIPAGTEPVSRQRRRRGGPGGADDRALQAGERVTGVVVVEDQHGRRPRQAGRHVLREAGDPLQAVHPELPADGGRQRDDPGRRAVGEAQEVRRRVHRIAGTVYPVGLLDQLGDLPFPAAQRVADLAAGDDRERRRAHAAHRAVTSMVGEQSASRTGSARPASTSRGTLVRLAGVRGPDVVHQQEVAGLPGLAHGVGFVGLVEELHDVLANRVAMAEPGGERQPVLAVEIHQVLAHLGVDRPLVEERDLVEPAALAGDRVAHHRAAALPGAQGAVGLPLEFGRVGPAVPLDLAAVGGAERLLNRCPEVLVVVADEHPALPLEPLDQVGGQRAEHGRRVGHRRRPAAGRGGQAGEHHQAGKLKLVAQLVVHAHLLVRRPRRGGVQAAGIGLPGREGLLFRHQAAREPLEDGAGLGRVVQPQPADQDAAVLGDHGAQRVTVPGGPVRRGTAGLGPYHRGPARLQVYIDQ